MNRAPKTESTHHLQPVFVRNPRIHGQSSFTWEKIYSHNYFFSAKWNERAIVSWKCTCPTSASWIPIPRVKNFMNPLWLKICNGFFDPSWYISFILHVKIDCLWVEETVCFLHPIESPGKHFVTRVCIYYPMLTICFDRLCTYNRKPLIDWK